MEKIIKPPTGYLDEMFDSNTVVKLDSLFSISKFMMVTMKLVGDKIVCDGKNQVEVIDAKTMQ